MQSSEQNSASLEVIKKPKYAPDVIRIQGYDILISNSEMSAIYLAITDSRGRFVRFIACGYNNGDSRNSYLAFMPSKKTLVEAREVLFSKFREADFLDENNYPGELYGDVAKLKEGESVKFLVESEKTSIELDGMIENIWPFSMIYNLESSHLTSNQKEFLQNLQNSIEKKEKNS